MSSKMPFFAGLEPLHFDFFFWQISAPQKVNSGFPEIVQTSTAKNKLKLNACRHFVYNLELNSRKTESECCEKKKY